MRLTLDLPCVLAVLLATACSDDGLSSQSSGQAPTSTAGLDDGEADPSTGSDDSAPATGTAGTSAEPPGDGTSGSEGPADSGTTALGTSGSTGSASESTDGTTGGSPSEACAAGCAVEFLCGTEWKTEQACVDWCEANLVEAAMFSPFCRAAWEGVSACLATLTCEELEQWQAPMELPYPCSDADVVLEVECKGQ